MTDVPKCPLCEQSLGKAQVTLSTGTELWECQTQDCFFCGVEARMSFWVLVRMEIESIRARVEKEKKEARDCAIALSKQHRAWSEKDAERNARIRELEARVAKRARGQQEEKHRADAAVLEVARLREQLAKANKRLKKTESQRYREALDCLKETAQARHKAKIEAKCLRDKLEAEKRANEALRKYGNAAQDHTIENLREGQRKLREQLNMLNKIVSELKTKIRRLEVNGQAERDAAKATEKGLRETIESTCEQLEAVSAKRDRLQVRSEHWRDQAHKALSRINELRAENERLREELAAARSRAAQRKRK